MNTTGKAQILAIGIMSCQLVTGCAHLGESVAQRESPIIDVGVEMPIIKGVERQPFVSQTERLIDAMQFAGNPFSTEDESSLRAAIRLDAQETVRSLPLVRSTAARRVLAGARWVQPAGLRARAAPAARTIRA